MQCDIDDGDDDDDDDPLMGGRKNVFVLFSSPASFVMSWRSKYGAIHHFLWPETTLVDSIILCHHHHHWSTESSWVIIIIMQHILCFGAELKVKM